MVAASSIGPGATNMVTAAGVAHTNRLPVLLLSRRHLRQPRCPTRCCSRSSTSATRRSRVNDAFKPVTRYWDRITRPEQIIASLPQAVAAMLDPADCGPAFLGLCQDAQAEAFDYPEALLRADASTASRARGPTCDQLDAGGGAAAHGRRSR